MKSDGRLRQLLVHDPQPHTSVSQHFLVIWPHALATRSFFDPVM
jgi:hypothetical protein